MNLPALMLCCEWPSLIISMASRSLFSELLNFLGFYALLLCQEFQVVDVFLQDRTFRDILNNQQLIYLHEARHLLVYLLVQKGDIIALV